MVGDSSFREYYTPNFLIVSLIDAQPEMISTHNNVRAVGIINVFVIEQPRKTYK